MSLMEDLSKRLEAAKKSVQELQVYVSSIEGKRLMKDNDISSHEARLEKLKADILASENKAVMIIREANDEAQAKTDLAKKLLAEAQIAQTQANEDKIRAQKTMTEATALMTQALQRQKEADNMYNQYQERKNKLTEALR